jgi:RimJ/RimL family protein N-acetyltransferase
MNYEIKVIDSNNKYLINIFLENIGKSNLSFRYFEKREIVVINNHLITCVLMLNSFPIGYAHLDKENNIIWLGIAIIENQQGKGYGNILMRYLVAFAKNKKIYEIFLTVDLDNLAAIHLYKKFNFKIVKNELNHIVMKLNLNE